MFVVGTLRGVPQHHIACWPKSCCGTRG